MRIQRLLVAHLNSSVRASIILIEAVRIEIRKGRDIESAINSSCRDRR